jgi:CO dehydrogenase maturation factor
MRIAIAGKGGSGKTTVAAVVARTLARQGGRVVALDCDSNPNLGLSLGLGPARTMELAAIRQALDTEGLEHAPDAELVLERFGEEAPDGVRLAVVTRIDRPNPG